MFHYVQQLVASFVHTAIKNNDMRVNQYSKVVTGQPNNELKSRGDAYSGDNSL